MARVTIRLEDVNGSFRRLIQDGSKVFKAELAQSVKDSAFAAAARMKATAPVGPDAPHIRDAVEVQVEGTNAYVGYLTDSEQASVALYNEYRPNRQPFMRAALEDEDLGFRARSIKACQRAEDRLSGGGLM